MLDSQKEETLGAGSHNHITDESLAVVDNSFSVPGLLRKVLAAELGNDDAGRDHKLIVIAVDLTVMLESGFVVDGFHFHNEWLSDLITVSLLYTLPESVRGAGQAAKKVVLKFQNLGKFINVYGTLDNGSGKRGPYRVRLNEDKLVPFLMEIVSGQDGKSSKEVLIKFWRIVKDKVALPLLIDLCEEAGLELPPCFMRLPTELKLKILESLRGVDVAKASSVCSELRNLASSDDLWKVKFAEEFSNQSRGAQVSWKKAYSMLWSRRRLKTRYSLRFTQMAISLFWKLNEKVNDRRP